MGEVYLAEDTELSRLVALKFLQTDVARDERRMSRFVQEARAATGDEAFEAAFGEGKPMRLKKAIALARETH